MSGESRRSNGEYGPALLLIDGDIQSPRPGHDEDAFSRGHGLYAVYDGAGGVKNASAASDAAKTTIEGFAFSAVYQTEEEAMTDMTHALLLANDAVIATGGITTASVVRVVRIFNPQTNTYMERALYGSVGDSRIMQVRDGRILFQTWDECFEHFLTNCLGKAGVADIVRQVGVLDIRPGDVFAVVSDGITGDKGDDVLSDAELTRALMYSKKPLQIANELVRVSRKFDDKTAVVFVVGDPTTDGAGDYPNIYGTWPEDSTIVFDKGDYSDTLYTAKEAAADWLYDHRRGLGWAALTALLVTGGVLAAKYLDGDNGPETDSSQACIAVAEGANVRTSPEVSSDNLAGTAPLGDKLVMCGQAEDFTPDIDDLKNPANGTWVKVDLSNVDPAQIPEWLLGDAPPDEVFVNQNYAEVLKQE